MGLLENTEGTLWGEGPTGRGDNGPVWDPQPPWHSSSTKATHILRWAPAGGGGMGWGLREAYELSMAAGDPGPRMKRASCLFSHGCPAETCRSWGERGFPHGV